MADDPRTAKTPWRDVPVAVLRDGVFVQVVDERERRVLLTAYRAEDGNHDVYTCTADDLNRFERDRVSFYMVSQVCLTRDEIDWTGVDP